MKSILAHTATNLCLYIIRYSINRKIFEKAIKEIYYSDTKLIWQSAWVLLKIAEKSCEYSKKNIPMRLSPHCTAAFYMIPNCLNLIKKLLLGLSIKYGCGSHRHRDDIGSAELYQRVRWTGASHFISLHVIRAWVLSCADPQHSSWSRQILILVRISHSQ